MKRYLQIDEKDFEILSKFASTTRTMNNTLGLLDLFLYHNKDNAEEDRANIAIEELNMLKDVIEHLNNDAKNLRGMEYNFATSSIYREEYLKRVSNEMEAIRATGVKIGTTEFK